MQIQEQVAGIRSRTDDLLHLGEDLLVEVSKLVLTSDWRSLNRWKVRLAGALCARMGRGTATGARGYAREGPIGVVEEPLRERDARFESGRATPQLQAAPVACPGNQPLLLLTTGVVSTDSWGQMEDNIKEVRVKS
jgi:hypothetical protein